MAKRVWRGVGLAVGLAVGALTLSSCASDPDVSGLQSSLSALEGVREARVSVQHSGSPWSTQINVLLFVDEPTAEGIAEVVRQAAPALAADPASAKREVSIAAIDGDPAELVTRSQALASQVPEMREVGDVLGIDNSSTRWLELSAADVASLADASGS